MNYYNIHLETLFGAVKHIFDVLTIILPTPFNVFLLQDKYTKCIKIIKNKKKKRTKRRIMIMRMMMDDCLTSSGK